MVGWSVLVGWLIGLSVIVSEKTGKLYFFITNIFFIKHLLITCITGVINVNREAILELLLSEH